MKNLYHVTETPQKHHLSTKSLNFFLSRYQLFHLRQLETLFTDISANFWCFHAAIV